LSKHIIEDYKEMCRAVDILVEVALAPELGNEAVDVVLTKA